MKRKDKDKILNYLVLTLICILLLGAIIYFVINNTNNNKPPSGDGDLIIPGDDGSQGKPPTLVVSENITIDKLEFNTSVAYVVTDIGNYNVTVYVEDTSIAEVDDNLKIIPKKVGSTRIVTEINTNPKIQKFTNLTINDVVESINYKFLNTDSNETNTFYVGEFYYLQITENVNVDMSSVLNYSNDQIECEFVEKTENVLIYKFKPKVYGNITFDYVNKYCIEQIDITAYNKPTDFAVNFNLPSENNTINLYLYNVEYNLQANLDGCFNTCTFNITLQENVIDNVNVTFSGGNFALNGNVITASCEGSGEIKFKSEISGVEKVHNIIVTKITPNELVVNNENLSLNTTITKTIKINTEYDLEIKVNPIYYLGTINIQCKEGITLIDDKVILTSDTASLVINYDGDEILTINFNKEIEYTISASLENVYNCTANKNEDTIVVDNIEQDSFIYLQFVIKDENKQNFENQEFLISIDDKAIVNTTNGKESTNNGYLPLAVLKSGTAKVTVTHTLTNVSKTIIIKVN